ncbi:GNAT family N-acetyltransferase [Streptomyces glebosus]|uniref:GNAT family N-acetyltransferase n=1 Tax=Streptomyces glebosus TaxID=249580 RepID=A0A640SP66_9ACTN|nr:GNAT family N-acetyltransferase [Streptomyces glebosus]GFE13097.1 GNAT family N-acetyltransferase [Streptomyces glebosus]GHG78206.1 GNAT family N-acetyltransferase [Streptomyces glebosus]
MIRRRQDSDLDACVAVLAEVHTHSGYPHHWPDDPARWLTPDGLTAAWVAETDGTVAGHAALCGPEVSRLYVAPAARGAGLGGRLLRAVGAEAAARGLRPVLEVKATDTAALALYERLGWRRRATERQDWGGGEMVTVHRYAAPPLRPAD